MAPCLTLPIDWADGSPNDLRANPNAVEVPETLRRLVKAARQGQVPVVWTAVQFNQRDMSDAGVFYLKHPHLNIWQVGDKRGYDQWVEGLVPAEDDIIIRKQYPSPFFGTTLATTLRNIGADTLVIAGVSTSGCVRAAVSDRCHSVLSSLLYTRRLMHLYFMTQTLDAMCHGFRPMVSLLHCKYTDIQLTDLLGSILVDLF